MPLFSASEVGYQEVSRPCGKAGKSYREYAKNHLFRSFLLRLYHMTWRGSLEKLKRFCPTCIKWGLRAKRLEGRPKKFESGGCYRDYLLPFSN